MVVGVPFFMCYDHTNAQTKIAIGDLTAKRWSFGHQQIQTGNGKLLGLQSNKVVTQEMPQQRQFPRRRTARSVSNFHPRKKGLL
jgi:hypothetical protein